MENKKSQENINETKNPLCSESIKPSNNQIKNQKELFKTFDKIEDKMDNNNKIAYNVMKNQGITAAVEHMIKHPKTGEPMDYSTMRYYYG